MRVSCISGVYRMHRARVRVININIIIIIAIVAAFQYFFLCYQKKGKMAPSKKQTKMSSALKRTATQAEIDERRAKDVANEKIDSMLENDEIEPELSQGALERHTKKRRKSLAIAKYGALLDAFKKNDFGGSGTLSSSSSKKRGSTPTQPVQRPTAVREGMTLALGITEIRYRCDDDGGDGDGSGGGGGGGGGGRHNRPTGPEVRGVVIPRSVSFSGVADYGKIRDDGKTVDVTIFTRTKLSEQEKMQMAEEDASKGRKRSKLPTYRVEKKSDDDVVTLVCGESVIKVDVFRMEDGLGPNRIRFQPGQVIMCHGVNLERRIRDPVNFPDGFTGFSASSMTLVPSDSSLSRSFDLSKLATMMKPSRMVMRRLQRDPVEWPRVCSIATENMDIGFKEQTKLMKRGLTKESRDMLAAGIVLHTDGNGDDDDDDQHDSFMTEAVTHTYRPMQFAPTYDSESWLYTGADGVSVPRVEASVTKMQIMRSSPPVAAGAAGAKEEEDDRVLIAHIRMVIPNKYAAPYGIANPTVSCSVFPFLVPAIPAAFSCFCDFKDTINAPHNTRTHILACDGCLQLKSTINGVASSASNDAAAVAAPMRIGEIECMAVTYVAKNVFPDLAGGLLAAAANIENLNVFEVDLSYAVAFLDHKRRHQGYSSAASSSWAEKNALEKTGAMIASSRDGGGGGGGGVKPLFNVAESAHTPFVTKEHMIRWLGFRFVVVYGFDIKNGRKRDAKAIIAANLTSAADTAKFLTDEMSYHEDEHQVVYAMSKQWLQNIQQLNNK